VKAAINKNTLMNLNKAIRQVVEKGYYVPDVFRRLGV
jgi:hypothetical protein